MQASPPPLDSIPSNRVSLPHKRTRLARPLKDPDKHVNLPNADISIAGAMQLFSEIQVNEQALIATVSKRSVVQEDAALILDRVGKVSFLVPALPLAVAPLLYETLQEYNAVLEEANYSIAESKTMMHDEAKDLHDILALFESKFRATSSPVNLTDYVPTGADQSFSQTMFQYAHGFVISGGQFHNQYVVHTDSSCEHSDKILRRLNYLIAIVLF